MRAGVRTQTSAARAILELLPPFVAGCAHGPRLFGLWPEGAAMSRAPGPKSVAPVSLAGSYPPAAAAVSRHGCKKPEPVSNYHDH
jgi:hypothetical protein